MSEAINKKKWMLFLKQAKGADVTEIHVGREDRAAAVVLRYNGKSRRFGRAVTAEWLIDSKDKEPAKVEAEVREFLERARKSFFVKREGSLAGEAYKSAQDDEAQKAKQLAPATEAEAAAPAPPEKK